MPPQGTNLVLTADIPDVKLDILVGDRLDVEADGGDGGDVLAELELVEDGGLAGGVEAEHEEAHFLGSEDLAHDFGELATHGWTGVALAWSAKVVCGGLVVLFGVWSNREVNSVLVVNGESVLYS